MQPSSVLYYSLLLEYLDTKIQPTASCDARQMKGNNVRYTSERVTSAVPPYTDHSSLSLISNKANSVSDDDDQKLSLYGWY